MSGKEPSLWQLAGRALAAVDWPRALGQAGAFMRALRGDSAEDVNRDSIRAHSQGTNVSTSLENMARKAAGCVAPAPCTCAVCKPTEQGT
jgi:hypothetical protein